MKKHVNNLGMCQNYCLAKVHYNSLLTVHFAVSSCTCCIDSSLKLQDLSLAYTLLESMEGATMVFEVRISHHTKPLFKNLRLLSSRNFCTLHVLHFHQCLVFSIFREIQLNNIQIHRTTDNAPTIICLRRMPLDI